MFNGENKLHMFTELILSPQEPFCEMERFNPFG